MSEAQPSTLPQVVWANRSVLSLGAVGSLVLIIIPAVIWFATISSKLDYLEAQQKVTWSRMDAFTQDRNQDTNRITALETIYPQIERQLSDIKETLNKIETRITK